jgi:hypothetical protein
VWLSARTRRWSGASVVAAFAALLLAALTAAYATAATAPEHDAVATGLQFRGQVIVPTGITFRGTKVGGLSGIAHSVKETFYALSDDHKNPRFYKLRVRISDGRLRPGDVAFESVTVFKRPDGTSYAPESLDPEGFALTSENRRAIITSEGFADREIAPWIRAYKLDGSYVADLPVDESFIPDKAGKRGVRQNRGFESAATYGRHFLTATEAALQQDGRLPTPWAGTPARVLRYQLVKRKLERQWTYMTDPIEWPVPRTPQATNGLADLLPVDDNRLIALERSFSFGASQTGGYAIRLYLVDLANNGSTAKKLLFNLNVLGIPMDNIEAMAFGPRLADGRRTLLLVSDNNFSRSQITQFLLFTVDFATLSQGREGPSSPPAAG